MNNRALLVVIITTLVFASIGRFTQVNIDYLLADYSDQLIRRSSRRSGRRKEDQSKLTIGN